MNAATQALVAKLVSRGMPRSQAIRQATRSLGRGGTPYVKDPTPRLNQPAPGSTATQVKVNQPGKGVGGVLTGLVGVLNPGLGLALSAGAGLGYAYNQLGLGQTSTSGRGAGRATFNPKDRPKGFGKVSDKPEPKPQLSTLRPGDDIPATQYPEGVPTGVGGGNAAQAQSIDADEDAYIPPTGLPLSGRIGETPAPDGTPATGMATGSRPRLTYADATKNVLEPLGIVPFSGPALAGTEKNEAELAVNAGDVAAYAGDIDRFVEDTRTTLAGGGLETLVGGEDMPMTPAESGKQKDKGVDSRKIDRFVEDTRATLSGGGLETVIGGEGASMTPAKTAAQKAKGFENRKSAKSRIAAATTGVKRGDFSDIELTEDDERLVGGMNIDKGSRAFLDYDGPGGAMGALRARDDAMDVFYTEGNYYGVNRDVDPSSPESMSQISLPEGRPSMTGRDAAQRFLDGKIKAVKGADTTEKEVAAEEDTTVALPKVTEGGRKYGDMIFDAEKPAEAVIPPQKTVSLDKIPKNLDDPEVAKEYFRALDAGELF